MCGDESSGVVFCVDSLFTCDQLQLKTIGTFQSAAHCQVEVDRRLQSCLHHSVETIGHFFCSPIKNQAEQCFPNFNSCNFERRRRLNIEHGEIPKQTIVKSSVYLAVRGRGETLCLLENKGAILVSSFFSQFFFTSKFQF